MRLADNVIHLGIVIALGGKYFDRSFKDACAGFLRGGGSSVCHSIVDRLVSLFRA